MTLTKLDQIKVYCGNKNLKQVLDEKPFPVFSQNVISLFKELSEILLKNKKIKHYPDLASFGFFCREKNLLRLSSQYSEHIDKRSGRGLAIHFTPSNVPLNFAYSLFFSLVSGNTTFIRIGDNHYEQTKFLLKTFNTLLKKKEYLKLKKKISIVNYEKDNQITDYLSKKCEVRIIWGGDNSINVIRESKLNPKAYELTFPDRYSICIICSENFIKSKNFKFVVLNFYNDSLTFDQNACTSPRLIVWLGSSDLNNRARKYFWDHFNNLLKIKKYLSKDATTIHKIKSQYSAAIELGGKTSKYIKNSNIISSEVKSFPLNFEKFVSPGGFFLEFQCKDLNLLKDKISPKLQTITTIGLNNTEVVNKLKIMNSKGVYRVVNNGRSSDMEMVWDGYEVLFHLSKRVIF